MIRVGPIKVGDVRFLTEQISPSQNAPLRGSWCADDFGRVGGGRFCTSPGLRFVWVIIDNARNDGRHGRGTVTGWPTERFPAHGEHPAGAGEQVPAAWLARAAALCRERVLKRHLASQAPFAR